jgi:cobalt-precorrin 5A hydrolase
MKLSIISFTENGISLSKNIAKILEKKEYALYTKCSTYCKEEQTVRFVTQSIGVWAKEQFEKRNALLFIGACGIAVRAIAPHITDKLHDSPVLVIDEKGQYVIPLLSGHVGGANELAISIAEKIGAKPVITTATDINNKFAIDMFAKKNGLTIVSKDGIAKVSSKVLAGKCIMISIENGHLEKVVKLPKDIKLVEYPPLQKVDVVITSEAREFETAILLRPKEYVIGVGCRKGKEADKIENFIMNHLQKAGISLQLVFGMASIDVKKDEPGFLSFSKKERLNFITYTAEDLMCVEGEFHTSEFVREQVGVDNVCERAALNMCGQGGKLVYEKHAEDGMTIAIAKREWRVNFNEE